MNKIVKENLNFKRVNKNIYNSLGIGLYYKTWNLDKIKNIPNGHYIALATDNIKAVIKKENQDWFTPTYWTVFGPEPWIAIDVLHKENIISYDIEIFFKENIKQIIPMKYSLYTLSRKIGKSLSNCSWQEIIKENES